MTQPAVPQTKSVEVVLPVVKIQIEHLKYLIGLRDDGVKCSVRQTVVDRLLVLNLIEYKDLPPCPKKMKEFVANDRKARKVLRDAMMMETVNWDAISHMPYDWKRKPQPRRELVLTKTGKKLIAEGAAKVVVQGGCR